MIRTLYLIFYFFFFNDTATTEIYTLSLHDALPIYVVHQTAGQVHAAAVDRAGGEPEGVVAHVAQVVRREPADAVELGRAVLDQVRPGDVGPVGVLDPILQPDRRHPAGPDRSEEHTSEL